MTIAIKRSPIEVVIGKGDVRTIQRRKTWAQFEYLQKGFEHTGGVKFFYYNGTIEILMPGAAHELFKKIIAILIEVFLLDRTSNYGTVYFDWRNLSNRSCRKISHSASQLNKGLGWALPAV